MKHLAWVLFTLGAAMQASFLFTGGTDWQTISSVLLLSFVSIVTAYRIGGARYALIVSGGVMAIGFLAEVIGVATGFPFGEYAYSGGLGWALLDVSIIVPFAWLMLAYPSWWMAAYIIRGIGKVKTAARILLGAWGLTTWDIFLDTQMVNAGNWGWAHPEPSLIGTPGIPLTNYLGWLVVSVLMMTFIELVTRMYTKNTYETQPVLYAVYLWTYIGSIIANLTFFNSPMIAVTGGVLMGTVVLLFTVVVANRSVSRRRLNP